MLLLNSKCIKYVLIFSISLWIAACIPEAISQHNSKFIIQNLQFPADARIVNVRDFGAQGNGKTDDTKAIQQAITWAIKNAPSRYAAPPFVYFPKGTYLVSDELQSRIPSQMGKWADGWRAGMLLVGENQSQSKIKLIDNTLGYDNPEIPKAIIQTGSEHEGEHKEGGGNRAFRHSIINLTIDTGKGNLGAIGIDYLANNRGTIENVTICSSDNQGVAGISMIRNWPGPALVKNVTIRGFDYGIKIAHYDYSMTFEHLRLESQNIVGIYNKRNTLAIRDLQSNNSVPAIQTVTKHAYVILIDGNLQGGSKDNTAIITAGKILVRNLNISGYGQAIEDQLKNQIIPMSDKSTIVKQYASDIVSLSSYSPSPLNLPIKDTPIFHTNDFSKWANVEDFGATPNDNSDDDAFAIQAAIDSGAEVVYLPNGIFRVEKPLILRGKVKKLMGMQSSLRPKSNFPKNKPLLRFDGTEGNFTVIEHLDLSVTPNSKKNPAAVSIEHNSDKTLAVRHCDTGRSAYRNTQKGTGDMFWEDNTGKRILIRYPQNFWARQLNAEFGNEPLVENNGGNLWILGMKTEGQQTVIKTVKGKTELLSGYFRTLRPVKDSTPLFINDEGQVSLSWAESYHAYKIKLKERQNGKWKSIDRDYFLTNISQPISRNSLLIGKNIK